MDRQHQSVGALAASLARLEEICQDLAQAHADANNVDGSFRFAEKGDNGATSSCEAGDEVRYLRQEGRRVLEDSQRMVLQLSRSAVHSRDPAHIGAVQKLDFEFQSVKRVFMDLYSRTSPTPRIPQLQGRAVLSQNNVALLDEVEGSKKVDSRDVRSPLQVHKADDSGELRHRERRLQDFRRIQQQVTELAELHGEIAALVDAQTPVLDNIESAINDADHSVIVAVEDLGKANKSKRQTRAVVFPLTGLVVGGLLAGPVGMVAGLKTGAVLGVAALGATSGTLAGVGLHKMVPST